VCIYTCAYKVYILSVFVVTLYSEPRFNAVDTYQGVKKILQRAYADYKQTVL